MDGSDGRLSADYVQAVLSLANGSADEVRAEPHARVAPDPAPVAEPAAVHGRLARGYAQAVAEFLAKG
jgi:hypothetical protein